MKIAISQLRHIVELGTMESEWSDSIDGSSPKFVSQRKIHCAYYQRSQTQQYSLIGTALEGTIVIAVRSQYKIDNSMLARLDGDNNITYKIVAISRGVGHTTRNYDLLTLKDTRKVGANNG